MATASNSRRDLYASSEPRPKDSTKKRAASPHKKSPMQKNPVKRPKKELSQEEVSMLTYQSISLLLDAARMLDEAEKKAATVKPSPLAKPTPAPRPPVKLSTPSTSVPATPIPAVTTSHVPPRSPAKLIYDDTPSSSSIAVAALTLLTESPPRSSAAPEPITRSPQVPQAVPINRTPYPAPVYRVVQSIPRPAPIKAAAPTVVAPVSRVDTYMPMAMPSAAIPMVSPSMPILRPVTYSAHPDTLVPMMHRQVSAIPIPAELADIAVPVAPRSISSVPRKVRATRRPQKTNLPAVSKRKGKTAAQIEKEIERERNYGYPDECRTRVPNAVRRYQDRKEKKARLEREQNFFTDYYWK